jgi:4-hydroxybenzoate polyprenyltransferase
VPALAPELEGAPATDLPVVSRGPATAPHDPALVESPSAADGTTGHRFSLGSTMPVLLLRAAHPRQALLTALGLAVAAAVAGRPARELGLVLLTVLVGQAILGWDNDLVDRGPDRRHERAHKPVAQGLLDPGTVWFTLTCALLLVVPLSISSGTRAGGAYLLALLLGLAGDRFLRRHVLSFQPWVLSFALYPAFLAYGGWNGVGQDTPPTVAMTVLAALLGLGVHVLRALPGLVQDHQDDSRSLPLRIALRTGTPRLLVVASVYTAVVVVALLVAGRAVGLT